MGEYMRDVVLPLIGEEGIHFGLPKEKYEYWQPINIQTGSQMMMNMMFAKPGKGKNCEISMGDLSEFDKAF